MISASGEYIAVNTLWGTLAGRTTLSAPTSIQYESTAVKRIYGVDSSGAMSIVWDVWTASISASDISMTSSGGYVSNLISVESYAVDAEGGKHTLGYTLSKDYISPTTSTSTTTHTITLTQEGSGEQISITVTQAGRVSSSVSYGTPTVTSTSISTVAASGGTKYLTVYWSQTKTTTYDNGTTSSTTVTGNSTATVTSGSANNSSGAYISGGGVYVPSAGTTYYSSQRTAYTITAFTYTANGKSATASRTVYVYQSANTYTTSYKNYAVSLTNKGTGYVAAYDETVSISVSSTKEKYYTYTSGASTYVSTESCNAKLTSSYGSFYSGGTYVTSVTVADGSTVTFMPYENTGSSRTISVKATNSDSSSATYTLNITQNAALFNLEIKGSTSITASGGTIELTVVSTRNNSLYEISSSNVSVSGATLQSVVLNDILMDRYTVTISVAKNSSTSAKYITVTVTQPNGGLTEQYTIVQAASSSGGGTTTPTVTAEIDAYFQDTYMVYFDVYMYTTAGYIDENVVLKVQDSPDEYGTEYGSFEYPPPISDGELLSNTIEIYEHISPMYLCVYVGEELIEYDMINE